jgi:hypothetical protein
MAVINARIYARSARFTITRTSHLPVMAGKARKLPGEAITDAIMA